MSNTPLVEIIYIKYNRLPYTQITLPILLDCDYGNYNITIVDNGSTDGTIKYLKSIKNKNLKNIIFNRTNKGLVKPTKKFWNESKAKYFGKIDNDILVPKKFITTLVKAHEKIPELAILGYCHFRKEDINHKQLIPKISTIDNINIRKQPWIGGNYIAKSNIIQNNNGYNQSWKFIKKQPLHGFNKYQNKLTELGFINGYIADEDKQLFLWEHLDDPRHAHYMKNKDYDIRKLTDAEIIKWYKHDASELLLKY